MREMQLVRRAKQGDEAAFTQLAKHYRPLIRSKARVYYLPGSDKDDIIQEGMIGLHKAVHSFDGTQSSFHNFVDLCVTRNIITAVKSATRRKHAVLSGCRSLDEKRFADDGEATLGDLIANQVGSPEETLLLKWTQESLAQTFTTRLSDFEREVFSRYTQGESYESIAAALGRKVKHVDNALQRSKTKLIGTLETCSAN